jgi:hypothetical protein
MVQYERKSFERPQQKKRNLQQKEMEAKEREEK